MDFPIKNCDVPWFSIVMLHYQRVTGQPILAHDPGLDFPIWAKQTLACHVHVTGATKSSQHTRILWSSSMSKWFTIGKKTLKCPWFSTAKKTMMPDVSAHVVWMSCHCFIPQILLKPIWFRHFFGEGSHPAAHHLEVQLYLKRLAILLEVVWCFSIDLFWSYTNIA